MSTKHVILGVLMQCPGHGYRIKKIFAPFMSSDGLNDGQVYPILTRLEKDGLVRKEVVQQKKAPNKHIYHITDAGREEFINWLTGPEDESDPVKYDFFMQYRFLNKCNFFEHLSRDDRIQKLQTQIGAAQEKIAEYERIRKDMSEKGLSNYKLKIVDFGIETQLLKIRWVENLLEEELADRSARSRRQRKSAQKPPKPESTSQKKADA